MGFPKRFEKRQIQLTGDAATVFACLSEALAGAGVDVPDVGAAVADEAVDRKGFVAFAQRLVERVAGDPRGGRLVLLPAWEYLLDARSPSSSSSLASSRIVLLTLLFSLAGRTSCCSATPSISTASSDPTRCLRRPLRVCSGTLWR